MPKGKFIVLEGIDACGKSTQAKLLKKKLETKGFKVATFSFPIYNSSTGKAIAAFLRGEGEVKSRYEKARLYALNRFEAKAMLLSVLHQCDFVICDRYVESNLAYSTADLEEGERKGFIELLEKMEYQDHGLPKADLVIFFDMPPRVAQGLMRDKKEGREYLEGSGRDKDIYEKSMRFQEQVHKNYLRLSQEKGWRVVQVMKNDKILSPAEIGKKVLDIVLSAFPQ